MQYPLRIPEDLYSRAQQLAEAQGVSLNQFFLYAVATMVAEVETRAFFEQRAGGMTVEQAQAAGNRLLDKVPRGRPVDGDELPQKPTRSSPSRRRKATP